MIVPNSVHNMAPMGRVLSHHDYLKLKLKFYHVSTKELRLDSYISSEDYQNRPHYEFFRTPPLENFINDPKFRVYRDVESAFEEVRVLIAPQAPSRKTSIFGFYCLDCAKWFLNRSRKGGCILEIKPLLNSTVFIADLVWRNIAVNVIREDGWRNPNFPFEVNNQEEAIRRIAEAYWSGLNTTHSSIPQSRPEVLICGKALIGHRLKIF